VPYAASYSRFFANMMLLDLVGVVARQDSRLFSRSGTRGPAGAYGRRIAWVSIVAHDRGEAISLLVDRFKWLSLLGAAFIVFAGSRTILQGAKDLAARAVRSLAETYI